MGWSSGTELVETVARAIKKNVKEPKVRKALYASLVDAAESHDLDCQNEVLGIDPILDKIVGVDVDEETGE